jgi:hypothetical protein
VFVSWLNSAESLSRTATWRPDNRPKPSYRLFLVFFKTISYTDPIRTRGFTRCPVCTLFRRNRLLRPPPRSLLMLLGVLHLPIITTGPVPPNNSLRVPSLGWQCYLDYQLVHLSSADAEPLSRTATWRPDFRPVSSLFQQCRPLPSGKRTLQSNQIPFCLWVIRWRNATLCVL